MRKVGIALGGGGVRGLAHIPALERIDAQGIRPAAIAGTSMGSIVGALYASGRSGADIRAAVEDHIVTESDQFKDILSKAPNLLRWLSAVSLELGHGGFLKADGLLKYMLAEIQATTFEELALPLCVVATDYWSGEEVVFRSGELLPAIRASMAIPGVFSPVMVNGRVLVDGGLVNNVPYDLLLDTCDLTVAIDVAPARSPNEQSVPSPVDCALGMFDMLVEQVMENKRRRQPPSIDIQPRIADVRVLDFGKIAFVLEHADTAMEDLSSQLRAALA